MQSRVLAYVLLPDRRLPYQHRIVHSPTGELGPLVVEVYTTDALGEPCWVVEERPHVQREVLEAALLGGPGITRAEARPTRLDRYRRLVAWCEKYGIADPSSLWPDSDPPEVMVPRADFDRLAKGLEVAKVSGALEVIIDGVLVSTYGSYDGGAANPGQAEGQEDVPDAA